MEPSSIFLMVRLLARHIVSTLVSELPRHIETHSFSHPFVAMILATISTGALYLNGRAVEINAEVAFHEEGQLRNWSVEGVLRGRSREVG